MLFQIYKDVQNVKVMVIVVKVVEKWEFLFIVVDNEKYYNYGEKQFGCFYND